MSVRRTLEQKYAAYSVFTMQNELLHFYADF